MQAEPILLLITGGTIDKDYHATLGDLTFEKTHLNELLEQSNTTLDIKPQVLMLKDSLEMNDSDRQAMLQSCLDSDYQKIIITHGTDTMTDSAQYLMNSSKLSNKTIVFTGAMRPFKLGQSDAAFNIGSALMAVQTVANGVYIAMNGRLFQGHNVIKDKKAGQFILPG